MTPRAGMARLSLSLVFAALLSGCGGMIGRLPGLGEPDAPLTGERAAREIARLQILAGEDPSEPYWPFRIAEIRSGTGDAVGTDTALDEALRRDRRHAPSIALRSKRWFEAGRHDDAIALLEAARNAGTPSAEALELGLALHYEAVGRVDEADAIVTAILERGGDWKESGAALTYLRLRGSDFAASREVARRALKADGSAVNHNNYGIALLYAGEPHGARSQFERAAKKDPTLPGPLYNLAIVDHFYLFDAERARHAFARYRELSHEDPDGLEAALSQDDADVAANWTEESQ